MLSSITIENFRCFNSLKVKGFKNINLIGGQNNSGKTALLEALLLSFFPSPKSMTFLRQFRNEKNSIIKNAAEKVWNYFFYNQDKEQTIKIVSSLTNGQTANLELSITKDIEFVLRSISDIIGNNQGNLSDLLSSKFSDIPLLNVKGTIFKGDFNYFLLPDKENTDIRNIGKIPAILSSPTILHSSHRLSDSELTNLYSWAKEKKKIKTLNAILTVLDNRIVGSEIDAPGGEPVLKLILNDEQTFPLAMFGDAVRKITELVLVLLNTSNSIILVDEIENGIHFTKHKELWEKLFEVIEGTDIQIFATSHSAEMIKAFNDATYQTKFEGNAMYFEMARTLKTQQIIANPMDMEMLNYELLTNNSYRGE
jgi:AAA15 family ATPase/GTPase